MTTPTYVSRALAGEFGPLEDSNEAALLDALLLREEDHGLEEWEYDAVTEGVAWPILAPILRAHRERREMAAQLASLGTLVCEMAVESVLPELRRASGALNNASRKLHDRSLLRGNKGANLASVMKDIEEAARAMGVEVQS